MATNVYHPLRDDIIERWASSIYLVQIINQYLILENLKLLIDDGKEGSIDEGGRAK